MKALSVQQPWAGLIAAGIKTVENRNWGTGYRGPLAIHASARPDTARLTQIASIARRAGVGEPLDEHLRRMTQDRGAIIAVAELVDVRRCNRPPFNCDCGPWAVRRQMHWHLADIRKLATPIGARGSLGLWNVPQHVEGDLNQSM